MDLEVHEIVSLPPRQKRAENHFSRYAMAPDHDRKHAPFLVMLEDWFAPPAGFPTHPHRGIETITFVLDGQLIHRDHTGAHGVIDAGGVQFMTAGGGVMHSEMPGREGAHTLQLWLNLPARLKCTPARYRDMQASQAPVHAEAGVEARVFAGAIGAACKPHGSIWPATIVDLRLDEGAGFRLPVPAGYRVFALVLEGFTKIGTEQAIVRAGMAAWAKPQAGEIGANFLSFAAELSSRVLIYASLPFDEPVVVGGPFVMNTQAEIDEAFADLRAGRLTVAHANP
jgi:quercetin 2,3-dioxygenase